MRFGNYLLEEYHYVGNCVGLRGGDIEKMIDSSKEVSYNELVRAVGEDNLKETFPYYDWERGKGLTLKKDYAVSYNKGRFRGKECYYVDHSAIEYVFCK